MKRKRYVKADFDWAKWTPKQIGEKVDEILKLKKERYAAIRAVPRNERTFLNTVYALESSDDDIGDTISKIGLLKEVSPNKEVRAAAANVAATLHEKFVEIEFDPRMYAALKEYAAKREKLTGPDKILFSDMMKGYARMGFDLPEAKRQKLKANIKKMTKLSLAFSKNLNEYRDKMLVTKQELDGLPVTYQANLQKQGDKFVITLSYPDVFPYLAGAHDEERRKELFLKFSRRGGAQNVTLLKKLIQLRAENAKLLGYKTHFDYQTELRMAKSAKRVQAFLNDLERRTRARVTEDLRMVQEDKRRRTGNQKAVLGMHDVSYLFKQIRKERFDIDSDVVKEHFPFEHVKQATLESYQKLLGVKFKKRTDISLWHEDAQLYDIYDPKEGYLASFALDLYPREGKYGHAAAFEVIFGREETDAYKAPLATMVTNFPKPSKQNPSLMSHGEVETFFHEFGHIMHFTLTKAKYRAQAGFNTAMDFVEAPSQMLENWVWDASMLSRLSKHYKTGRPLPPDLIRRMIAARSFGEAWSVRGQIVLSQLDLTLHTKQVKDPNALYADLDKKMMGIAPPVQQLYLAGFGHLAGGYDAGYYGYLWSRVYAEDMFTRFAKEGVLNPKVGRDYRTWILEKGSSEEEEDLVRKFLGRKSNNKAFLKSIGV
jgi:thimet oligopeptidase